ncbi:HD-GYP domain-containing protein [Deinococcus radiopugnans]|uniref:HD-GYP domain-containing protein (C-di-GMP phosphodiesterase class II) n=2 Tax=Deinococcus radiopugnans ATCC 19172 TaxID=585398 RepID=A0ABR6NLF2_9DEIO|nr:HD domain-containing phosphohydrolase [Deinococcus radiopugnans]MBB6014855.1 HD-GYP domain-containing protein (c-di-GMP phosphodiesterase class II) [Deinococcus radiopugnans ATCC 19172]
MFRRPRPPQPPPLASAEARVPSASAPAGDMEAVRVLNELLARPTHEGVLEGALSHASFLLGGNLRGYAVTHRAQGQDRVTAVFGYPKALVGTPLSGPWAALRTRVLSDGSRELYEANPPELHGVLDTCGMRDVALSLVVPVNDRGRNMGALVLDRNTSEDIGLAAQELVTRWATAVAPLLGLLESRENWRLTARQVSSGVVEALESQEFDALGHGQAVAEASVKLGRAVGLAERELEELWFAATLHDLGKIHGEKGHAQVGANFLHGVPHMVQAQKAIRHHHERWDGQGEPDKLAGEDIPLYARILAVANAYVRLGDFERLRGQAGKGLDPRLVGLMEKVSTEPSAK